MIIILEGPDGGGKTTLAETLRAQLQSNGMTHVIKHGPYKGVQSEDLCKIFFRSMSQALTYDDHVIMDRSWLSEPIYGNVYRKGENRVDMPRRRMLERVALSRGAVVVLRGAAGNAPPWPPCAAKAELRVTRALAAVVATATPAAYCVSSISRKYSSSNVSLEILPRPYT